MSWGMVAVAGATLVTGLVSSNQQKKSARAAANSQEAAALASVDEQARQFDEIKALLEPYVKGGQGAFTAQQDLIGLNGMPAQSGAITALQSSPEFAAYLQQGENAILQNASATGGLRGGNTQQALMQFRPELLANLVNTQFNRLGAISQQGLGAATQQGAFGQTAASNIGNARTQIGQAQAGAALANGQANANMMGSVNQSLGMLVGSGVFGGGRQPTYSENLNLGGGF